MQKNKNIYLEFIRCKPNTPIMKKLLLLTFEAILASAVLIACGGSDSTPEDMAPRAVIFTNGQAASVVIGQADFTHRGNNRGGSPAANTLNQSFGSAFVNAGALYIPDYGNNRTLVFNAVPTANGASANLVLWQPDFNNITYGGFDSYLDTPETTAVSGGKLIQVDNGNHRLVISNSVPTSGHGQIDVVVGQSSKSGHSSGCSASSLSYPTGFTTANGKLVVTDMGNNRVLIWNTIPMADGTPADHVLGQSNFTTCSDGVTAANTLSNPSGAYSDGNRLAVIDTGNSRVLIWNSFPTTNNQPADLVLGQSNFSTSAVAPVTASSMRLPYDGIYFTSTQLFVVDSNNNRVLIWNTFPTTNGKAADRVLGQADMSSSSTGTTSTTLNNPSGLFLAGKQLIVSDGNNNRALIFNGN